MKYLICGGGTAGHLFPGLALAAELARLDPSAEIVFAGSETGLEATLVPQAGYRLLALPIKGMPRKKPLALLGFAANALSSLVKAIGAMRRERPDVVIGVGGFASFPSLAAAVLLRKPTVIHEQNSVPGIVNRFFGRFVDQVALSYGPSRAYFKRTSGIHITGNPLRPSILEPVDRGEAARRLGISPDVTTVLIFGGSRGARKINQAVVEAYAKLAKKPLQILHITGELEFSTVTEHVDEAKAKLELDGMSTEFIYKPYAFYSEIQELYAVSDLLVCRAGASTIAEITALGKAAILIPYPYATDDHQTKNAEMLTSVGAAKILLDSELSGERLVSEVAVLCEDGGLLDRMSKASVEYGRPDASRELGKMAYGLGSKASIRNN